MLTLLLHEAKACLPMSSPENSWADFCLHLPRYFHWQDLAIVQSPCANQLFLALRNYSATMQNSNSTVYFYFKLEIEKLPLYFFLSLKEVTKDLRDFFNSYQINTPSSSAMPKSMPSVCASDTADAKEAIRCPFIGKMIQNGNFPLTQPPSPNHAFLGPPTSSCFHINPQAWVIISHICTEVL